MRKYSSTSKIEDSTDAYNELRDSNLLEGDQGPGLRRLNSFECLVQASTLYRQSDVRAAIAMLQDGLEADPLNGSLYNALGHLYLEANDLKNAAKAFDEAAVHSPHNSKFQIDRIVIRGLQMKPNEAIILTQFVKPGDPHYLLSLILKAECHRENDQRFQAMETYQEAIKLEPRAADLRLNLGNLFAEEGNHKAAKKCYRDALKIDPRFPEANFYLARTLQLNGQLDKAVVSYKEAATLLPDSPFPLIGLGLTYGLLRNQQQCQEVFENALLQFPGSPYVLFNQGIASLNCGLVREACDSFERMIRSSDKNKSQKESLMEQIRQDRNTLQIAVEISGSAAFKRNHFTLNFHQLVQNFDLLFSSPVELSRRLSSLHAKIQHFPAEYRSKLELKEEVEGLRHLNPDVFSYLETFVLLVWRFANALPLHVPKQHTQFVTYKVFDAVKEERFLMGVPSLYFCTLITQVHLTRLSPGDIERIFAQFVGRDAPVFDPQEYFHLLLAFAFGKLSNGNRKQSQIKAFGMSQFHKTVLVRIMASHPDLREHFTTPPQLLALKDVLLSFVHILDSNLINETSKGFLPIFEKVYREELYTNTEKTMLYARTSSVFMRDLAPRNALLEFKLKVNNPQKSRVKEGFVFEIFSASYPDPSQPVCAQPVHWRTLGRSPILMLRPDADWSFKLPDLRTESSDIAGVRLKIVCWRQNKRQHYTQLDETVRPAVELRGDGKLIFQLRNYRYFTSTRLEVWFSVQVPG